MQYISAVELKTKKENETLWKVNKSLFTKDGSHISNLFNGCSQ